MWSPAEPSGHGVRHGAKGNGHTGTRFAGARNRIEFELQVAQERRTQPLLDHEIKRVVLVTESVLNGEVGAPLLPAWPPELAGAGWDAWSPQEPAVEEERSQLPKLLGIVPVVLNELAVVFDHELPAVLVLESVDEPCDQEQGCEIADVDLRRRYEGGVGLGEAGEHTEIALDERPAFIQRSETGDRHEVRRPVQLRREVSTEGNHASPKLPQARVEAGSFFGELFSDVGCRVPLAPGLALGPLQPRFPKRGFIAEVVPIGSGAPRVEDFDFSKQPRGTKSRLLTPAQEEPWMFDEDAPQLEYALHPTRTRPVEDTGH